MSTCVTIRQCVIPGHPRAKCNVNSLLTYQDKILTNASLEFSGWESVVLHWVQRNLYKKKQYIWGWFNRLAEFRLGNWQYEAQFIIVSLSKKSILMVFFMSQNTVSMTFLSDCCIWDIFFTWESYVSTP